MFLPPCWFWKSISNSGASKKCNTKAAAGDALFFLLSSLLLRGKAELAHRYVRVHRLWGGAQGSGIPAEIRDFAHPTEHALSCLLKVDKFLKTRLGKVGVGKCERERGR